MGEHGLMAERTVTLPFESPLFDAVFIDVQPHLPRRVQGIIHVVHEAQAIHGHVARNGKTEGCVAGPAKEFDVFVDHPGFK